MVWENWMLDATMGCRDGTFCFCPIEGDLTGDDWKMVTGMNFVSDRPPGKVIAVIHRDGQEAVDKFCEEHAEAIEKMGIENDE